MRPSSGREFSYRYGGTYVGYNRPDGVRVAVYLEDVDDVSDFSARYNSDYFPAEFGNIDFEFPTLGYRTYENGIMHTSRAINRSYKRGIIERGIRAFNSVTGRPLNMGQARMDSLYNPEFNSTIPERGNVVISPDYALITLPEFKERVLLFQGKRVGYEQDGILKVPYVFDFLADDLSLADIKTEVVVNGNA